MNILICDLRPLHRELVRAINEAQTSTRHVSAINVSVSADGWSVIKYGVYPNKVGLQVFDRAAADAIVSAFNSRSNQLANFFRGEPIYVGHPDDAEWAKANPLIRAEAVGRIREVKAEADGLHLRQAFNEEGKRLVGGDAPAYTSFSPNWGMLPITYQGRKAFRPVELYSNGLTNQPNIPGTFIGLNEALPPETTTSNPMKEHLIKLLALLGITMSADATDAQATAAINEALPKVTTAVAAEGKLATALNEKAALETRLTSATAAVQTATNESATLRTTVASERSERAGLVITRAINEGRLTEAKRSEWLGKFTAQGADFIAVEGEINKLQKAVNTKSKTDDLGSRRGAPQSAEAKQRINAVNEAITAKMNSAKCDRTAAYLALQTEKPELFTATNA